MRVMYSFRAYTILAHNNIIVAVPSDDRQANERTSEERERKHRTQLTAQYMQASRCGVCNSFAR